MMYTSRPFIVSVDPTGLPPCAHTAYVTTAHTPANPGAGKQDSGHQWSGAETELDQGLHTGTDHPTLCPRA